MIEIKKSDVKASGVTTLISMLAEEFRGEPFEDSFRARAGEYARVLTAFIVEHDRVAESERLSQMGRLEEWALLEKAAARRVRELLAADTSGLDVHISSLVDQARRKFSPVAQSETAKLLSYMEARDVLSDLLQEDPTLLKMHLLSAIAPDDLAFRVLDHPVLAARLQRHIEPPNPLRDAMSGQQPTLAIDLMRARRDEQIAPEADTLRGLRAAYKSVAQAVLHEIGAPADVQSD